MVRKQIHTYTVKSFECDRRDTLRLLTLLNLFQDIADDSANEIGIANIAVRKKRKNGVFLMTKTMTKKLPLRDLGFLSGKFFICCGSNLEI